MQENVENLLTDNLPIDEEVQGYLAQTSAWAKYVGIIGYCFVMHALIKFAVGVYRFVSVLGFEYYFTTVGILTLMFSLLVIVAYTFISNFHFRFGTGMQEALAQTDQGLFNNACLYIKKAYRIIGALFIMYLAIVLLVLVLGGAATLFM